MSNTIQTMTLAQFIARAIGVRFRTHGRDFSGWDCWGLVWRAHREVWAVALPSGTELYQSARPDADLARVMAAGRDASWREVTGPVRAGDVVLLRCAGWPVHVGLAIGRGRMLHVEAGIDTCIECYDRGLWKNRVMGVWRHQARRDR